MRGGSSSLCDGRKSNRAATAARAASLSSTTTAGHAGVAGVAARAAELVLLDGHAGELAHHVGPAHEGVGLVGHHHVVGDAEQQRRARHGRAVDDDHGGHHARAGAERPGGLAPAVEGGEALARCRRRSTTARRPRAAARRARRGRPRRWSRRRGATGPRPRRCCRRGPARPNGARARCRACRSRRGRCRAPWPAAAAARPVPSEPGSGAEVGEGKEAIAVGATGGPVGGLRRPGRVGAEDAGSACRAPGGCPAGGRPARRRPGGARRAAPAPGPRVTPGGACRDRRTVPARPSIGIVRQSPPSHTGHRAGRDDGGAEPLEGERGHEAGAVDLGLRHAARSPARRTWPGAGPGTAGRTARAAGAGRRGRRG